jgi:hypothetical protein
MPAWNDSNYGNDQLEPVYAGIGQARQFSRALRSSNRYFLNQTGGGGQHPKIFGVAKFETRDTSPALADVVFAFANTDRDFTGAGNFDVNHDTNGNSQNDYGIKSDRWYNVKNIAAYTAIRSNRRDIWQWRVNPADEASAGQPRLGSDILANGIYVGMNRVPLGNGDWSSAPYEAQYLKLHDVTPPPAPAVPQAAGNLFATVLGNQVNFSWTPASDPDGGVAGYFLQIGTTPGGFDLFNGAVPGTSQMVSVPFGTTLHARVQQINHAGIYGAYSASSAATVALDPAADNDGDGRDNAAEHVAGTNPLDPSSLFRVTAVRRTGNDVEVDVATVAGRIYQLQRRDDLAAASWQDTGVAQPATGASLTLPDTGGAGASRRFYRVRVTVAP